VSFWTAMVLLVAMLLWAHMRRERDRTLGPRRGREPVAQLPSSAALEEEIVELKQRLAVLERIVTDERRSRAVADEIEALRDR
jgi:hypothetical protein